MGLFLVQLHVAFAYFVMVHYSICPSVNVSVFVGMTMVFVSLNLNIEITAALIGGRTHVKI